MKFLKAFWGQALLAALAVCALSMPTMARAEQNDTIPDLGRDWTVRIGMYIFNQNATANAGGRIGISGMVDRTVYKGEKYDVTVGIGYNGFDRIYSVPILISLVAHPGNLRIGGGAGYSFNKRIAGNGSSGAVIDLLLGYSLTHGKMPTNIDLRYYWVAGSSSELDGLGITYGMQF